MHVFISGVAGSGLSSLAHLCLDLGFKVSGSDLALSEITKILINRGLEFEAGQDPKFLIKQNLIETIDYYIYTPALPEDSAEKAQAEAFGIKTGKQNLLINQIILEKNLKLIAVAGTHGKTTTTAMLVWLFQKLNIPVSYIIGTSISFGNSGQYQPNSEYLVYEADEYDRKFLDLHPNISLIVSLDYDHPDIYPTSASYFEAFIQFCSQSKKVITHDNILDFISKISFPLENTNQISEVLHQLELENGDKKLKIPGEHNRQNAKLVLLTMSQILAKNSTENLAATLLKYDLIQKINLFPGTARRFERLLKNLHTDYAHHPSEIKATLELAHEFLQNTDTSLIVVYQPHQNSRQHKILAQYNTCFELADKIYWLPTYLSRENDSLPILSPAQLSSQILPSTKVKIFDLDQDLIKQIKSDVAGNNFVLLFGAGSIDTWFRDHLSEMSI